MAGFKESWDEGEGVCLGEGQGGGQGAEYNVIDGSKLAKSYTAKLRTSKVLPYVQRRHETRLCLPLIKSSTAIEERAASSQIGVKIS